MSELVKRLCDDVENGRRMAPVDLDEYVQLVAQRKLPFDDVEAWLKCVHKNGLSAADTVLLTRAMMLSGAVLQWQEPRNVIDKHSTGGVGDKMSLILAPALAACGMRVPMLAGRGLGHTGGTIDKLESIPGFNCQLSPEEMQISVAKVGCCIAAQNDSIAPADGLLYAVRDVTNTVDSIPLITASIVSKKAAEGLNALVLDVKCGTAAFMKTQQEAVELAQSMVSAAKGLGIETVAQITDMNEPIGDYIGNALEVEGSIRVLQGQGSADTRDLVVLQGGQLLTLTGYADTLELGKKAVKEVLENGSALEYFTRMCVQQGCSPQTVDQLIKEPKKVLPQPTHITPMFSSSDGYVQSIHAMSLAEVAREMGAGRFALEDEIQPAVGYILNYKKGDSIALGSQWIEIHHNEPLSLEQMEKLRRAIKVEEQVIPPLERLIRTVR